jgi:hypothetical protein
MPTTLSRTSLSVAASPPTRPQRAQAWLTGSSAVCSPAKQTCVSLTSEEFEGALCWFHFCANDRLWDPAKGRAGKPHHLERRGASFLASGTELSATQLLATSSWPRASGGCLLATAVLGAVRTLCQSRQLSHGVTLVRMAFAAAALTSLAHSRPLWRSRERGALRPSTCPTGKSMRLLAR